MGLAHRPGVYVLSFTVLADCLIRHEREDGLPRIVVRHLASGEEHAIAFPEEAYALGMDPGFEFATDTLRFTYSSMTTPTETWDYHLGERTRVLRKRQEIPSGHDPADYVTRRLLARGWIVLTGGTHGDTLTLTPPLDVDEALLEAFADALADCL